MPAKLNLTYQQLRKATAALQNNRWMKPLNVFDQKNRSRISELTHSVKQLSHTVHDINCQLAKLQLNMRYK